MAPEVLDRGLGLLPAFDDDVLQVRAERDLERGLEVDGDADERGDQEWEQANRRGDCGEPGAHDCRGSPPPLIHPLASHRAAAAATPGPASVAPSCLPT